MKRVVRVIFLFVACLLPLVADAQQSKNAIEQLQKLNSFYRHLSLMYVDSLDMKPIVERGIREMLSELDPHSTYLDAEEMKASQEADKGEFSGIGIQYNIHNDSIVVVKVLPNGPSERAGL